MMPSTQKEEGFTLFSPDLAGTDCDVVSSRCRTNVTKSSNLSVIPSIVFSFISHVFAELHKSFNGMFCFPNGE